MATRITKKPKVGQPYRLGPDEIAVFQAANEWTVFYLAYPEGEWMNISLEEWQLLACPISMDTALVVVGGNGPRPTVRFPIGMRVRHSTLGDGYVTRHDRRILEVCFFRTGPRLLKFSAEQNEITAITGVGELWPACISTPGEPWAVRPANGREAKAEVSRNPPASVPSHSLKHPIDDEIGEPQRPPLARGGLPLKAEPTLKPEQDSMPGSFGFLPTFPRVEGRPCTCSGSNENCKMCFGSGWIGPTNTAHSAVPEYSSRSIRNRRKRSRRVL